jgi:hypothetical protein
MKNTFIFIILIFSFLNLFSQPKLYIEKENITALDTIFPVEYDKYIMLYNKGSENLFISSLGASCGCTSFVLSKDTIPPLDSAELFIKINLSTAEVNKKYYVYFSSNDTLQPRTELDINLYVYRDLISEPKKLPSFSNVESGSLLTYNVSLVNSSDKDIEIQNPISSDISKFEIISIFPDEKIIHKHSKKDYEIKIKLKPVKFILSKLLIPTNSESVPKIEYLVMVNTN